MPQNNVFYLSSPVTLKAAKDGETGSRFSGVAYTGEFVPDYRLVVDLQSVTVADKMPLLSRHENHNHAALGVIKSHEITTDHKFKVSGELFSDIEEEAEKLAKKAKRGLPFQLSIGVFNGSIEYVHEGDSVTVNGRDFTGPLRVLRRGLIRETSIMPLGADKDTETTVLNQQTNETPGDTEVTELEQLQKQLADSKAALEAEQGKNTQLQADAEAQQAAAAAAAKAQREKEVKALFEAIGQDHSEAAAAPYMGMSQESFDAVSAQMTKLSASQSADDQFSSHLLNQESGNQENGGNAEGGVLLSMMQSRHGVSQH